MDAVAKAEIGELKVDKAVKKVLSMEDMHHKHHGHHGHHGKCGKGKGFNKFAKLEMMFKTLNDINVSEDGENKVLELDMKDILMKKEKNSKNIMKKDINVSINIMTTKVWTKTSKKCLK